MVCKEMKNPQTEEEYIEYWMTEGALKASKTNEFKKFSKQKEEKINMIVEIAGREHEKDILELIDDINSIENARSSIEMYNTVQLIYNDKNKRK